jgi:hypothetical protein
LNINRSSLIATDDISYLTFSNGNNCINEVLTDDEQPDDGIESLAETDKGIEALAENISDTNGGRKRGSTLDAKQKK